MYNIIINITCYFNIIIIIIISFDTWFRSYQRPTDLARLKTEPLIEEHCSNFIEEH